MEENNWKVIKQLKIVPRSVLCVSFLLWSRGEASCFKELDIRNKWNEERLLSRGEKSRSHQSNCAQRRLLVILKCNYAVLYLKITCMNGSTVPVASTSLNASEMQFI